MNPKQFEALAQKVKNGTASPQEELTFLKYLNQGIDEMRASLKSIMTKEAE